MDDIVRLLDLEPILHQKVNTLSGGQRRRVDIARAIVHAPKFLILDEPTTGLDPKTRQIVWGLIDKVRHETGMTVFLTTHYLEESELATDVVIMNHGKIIAQGTPNDLKTVIATTILSPISRRMTLLSKNFLLTVMPFNTTKRSSFITLKSTIRMRQRDCYLPSMRNYRTLRFGKERWMTSSLP